MPEADEVLYQRLRPDGSLRGEAPDLPRELLTTMYRSLLHARLLDKKIVSLSTRREIGVYPSCQGQEATQVGFALALGKQDWFAPMYRDSAAIVNFGFPAENLLAYFSGDERGMCIPKGVNMLPIVSPVSAQLAHAVGLAMALQMQQRDSAVLVATGDGGTSKGDFHESLNLAGVNKLPVVFAVENNQWALSVPRKRQTASRTLAQKAVAYGFEGLLVDGNDVIASYEASRYAVEKAARGEGPTLIEFLTFRLGPHTTAELVSNKLKAVEEVAEWEKRDPVERMGKLLRGLGILDDIKEESLLRDVEGEVEEVVRRFRAMTQPDPLDVFRYMYDKPTYPLLEQWREKFGKTDIYPASEVKEPTVSGGRLGVNIRNAINMALKQEMKRDPGMIVFGEDVGKNGGVFQVTRGLQDEFGPNRVFDTPLSEVCIAGIFVGLSIGGLTPVAEFQFDGFTYAGLDHIIGHIARLRNRTRGRFSCRGVIRFPYGAGVRAPEHHSDSPEAYFSHTPGLKVVIPSNPYDAKGLLASCLREPNPIVFMEPKKLYDTPRVEVPEEEYLVPIGKARVVRPGRYHVDILRRDDGPHARRSG